MTDEYFDVVDEDDNVVGKATRKECHTNPRLIHRAVSILLFNSKGKLLLQQRTMTKDLYPGYWGNPAGHVDSGETYDRAAVRELNEEMGIETELKFFAYAKKRTTTESENVKIFITYSDGPFNIDKNEVERIKFFDINDVYRKMRSREMQLTPSTMMAIEKYMESQ